MQSLAPPANHNTSPPGERRPARLRPITTIRPGERVRVSLRGKQMHSVNCWLGTVVAVDSVALRIAAEFVRFDWSWSRADGSVVVPWGRIADVTVGGGE